MMFGCRSNMFLFNNNHVLVSTFLLFLSLFRSSATPIYNANYCPSNASYQSNATFEANLRVLLASLVSNVSNSDGSYYSAMGMGTTSVANGQFLCRGDLSIATCQDCITTAATEIRRRCPNKTESVIWYDECTLRFTNLYFAPTTVFPGAMLPDDKNISASDMDSFNRTLFGLLNDLVEETANSHSARKFSAGESEFARSSTVYGFMECEPDLTSAQCKECLQNAVSTLPSCCGGKQGARALLVWCSVRYELYRFYNTTDKSPSSGNNKSVLRIVLIVVSVVVWIILLCCIGYFILKRSRKKYRTLLRENFGEESATLESLQFSLTTIETATKRFSHENKIGEGGFGAVYKAILPDGREIAVKKLSQGSGQGATEFKNEILLIAKLQHRNLVTLLGFCLEEQEKMLIYEFVPNKSLDYFLFDPYKSSQMSWSQRYKIIEGITQGILYLHEHSRLKVIHRDLKPSNVLLDNNMNPKISDFGMARIVAIDQHQGKTNRIVGTYGYMSPEYAMRGEFSEKSDVYSFGVIILEIISAKRNMSSNFPDHDDLLSYAWEQWRGQTLLNILDSNIKESCDQSEVIKCIQIGLLCVQEKPYDRPTMTQVISYLSSSITELPYPEKPINSKQSGIVQKRMVGESSSGSTLSNNEMSLSMFLDFLTNMLLFNINCVTVTSFLLLSLLGSLPSPTLGSPNYNDIYCPNNATYESNTTFQTNLNVLLASLTSNATQGVDSYATIMGFGTTNAVNGLFICRADLSSATCRDCVATAAADFTRRCPNQTESVIWYDECTVRYTNRYFNPTGIVPRANLWDDKNISASDWRSFNQTLFGLLNSLATEAAGSQSETKFASGEVNFTASSRVYGLAQCGVGMTNSQCEACLVNASKTLATCCQRKQGARALLASCNVRYELYQFYNTSAASPPVSPAPQGKKKSGSPSAVVIVVPVVVVSIILFCSVCYFLVRRSRKNYNTLLKENFGDESATLESLQFNLATIEVATKKFSYENKIGRGGFGEVYKGILIDGRQIAVKKLSRSSGQGAVEFKNEILLIAKLQHRNLVALIGFCLEDQEKMLIYEYVPNKSLDYFLFDRHKTRLLNWDERYKIIEGIAQGILYLHDHSRLKVIHRDLKPSNVLLDNNMNPKISDFGIARMIALEQDRGSTNRIVGTYGYMSPEYAMHGQFSEKSDVFSFGVIVLETISSKRNARSLLSDNVDDLLSDAWRQWRDETPLKILDQDIEESSNHNEVVKCIQIGLLCVQDKPSDRPTMAKVVSYLSNPLVELPYPGEPTNTMHKKILKKMVAGEVSSSSTFVNEMYSSLERGSTSSIDS
ncbi:uncharacterized protein LOC109813299 [Cajanus cajan]|uniref:uncharacterized protein LOC109813299 n=1 Tax=Cajanus cajan TaxID=3821 RepID=UPI0010FB8BBE|nr:uncharacterized protein LOC109813299 [Cajanus cajan]